MRNGVSWTRGYWTVTINPDNTTKELYVCSGPFVKFEVPIPFTDKKWQFYIGARPYPTWSEGYGNEGEGVFAAIGRWSKRHGFGNYGVANRIKLRSKE